MNAWNWLWALFPAVLSTITHCAHWLQIAWECLYLGLSNTDFQRFRYAFVDRLSLQKTSFQDYERIVPNKTFLRKIIIAHECVGYSVVYLGEGSGKEQIPPPSHQWVFLLFVWHHNSCNAGSHITSEYHVIVKLTFLKYISSWMYLTS